MKQKNIRNILIIKLNMGIPKKKKLQTITGMSCDKKKTILLNLGTDTGTF